MVRCHHVTCPAHERTKNKQKTQWYNYRYFTFQGKYDNVPIGKILKSAILSCCNCLQSFGHRHNIFAIPSSSDHHMVMLFNIYIWIEFFSQWIVNEGMSWCSVRWKCQLLKTSMTHLWIETRNLSFVDEHRIHSTANLP